MNPIFFLYLIVGVGIFIIGATIGSFINVCVYRIPWQKSVIWPASRCPNCLHAIATRDNVPILGWILLRGRCRTCGLAISPRYPIVEAAVAILFVCVFLVDVVIHPVGFGMLDTTSLIRMLYHQVLIALIVTGSLIDADLTIIPDVITVPGMVIGVTLGTLVPGLRPEPSSAHSMLEGLGVGLLGWAVGGGLIWAVRIVAGIAFRREALGFGDVTLMAMIGSFLGWQPVILTFFLGPFFGLPVSLPKLAIKYFKLWTGRPISDQDNELPFGPYLGMAAITLMLGWTHIWGGWAKNLFAILF